MPITGPACQNPKHSSVRRLAMERAYVRRQTEHGRTFLPVGWYCRFCGWLKPNDDFVAFDQ